MVKVIFSDSECTVLVDGCIVGPTSVVECFVDIIVVEVLHVLTAVVELHVNSVVIRVLSNAELYCVMVIVVPAIYNYVLFSCVNPHVQESV